MALYGVLDQFLKTTTVWSESHSESTGTSCCDSEYEDSSAWSCSTTVGGCCACSPLLELCCLTGVLWSRCLVPLIKKTNIPQPYPVNIDSLHIHLMRSALDHSKYHEANRFHERFSPGPCKTTPFHRRQCTDRQEYLNQSQNSYKVLRDFQCSCHQRLA